VRERDPALVKLLLPSGLLGVGIGTLLFRLLSPQAVAVWWGH